MRVCCEVDTIWGKSMRSPSSSSMSRLDSFKTAWSSPRSTRLHDEMEQRRVDAPRVRDLADLPEGHAALHEGHQICMSRLVI